VANLKESDSMVMESFMNPSQNASSNLLDKPFKRSAFGVLGQ